MPKYADELQLTSNGFVYTPGVFTFALDYKRRGNTRKWALGVLDAMNLPQPVAKGLLDGKREYRIVDESVVVPVTDAELKAAIALSQDKSRFAR